MNPRLVSEPARQLPVIHEADVCVLGGSGTGLFAAVRAARLGARVVIVEKQNCFGGVATLSMVNAWHSLMDTVFERQVIGGLTVETVTRLQRRGAIEAIARSHSFGYVFNSEELKLDLDELANESGLKLYLHTLFVAPYCEGDKLAGVVVENKSGRGVILARYFVDATGDGDLCARLPGVACYYAAHLQPATTCARFSHWPTSADSRIVTGIDHGRGFDVGALVREHGGEVGLPEGFMWGCFVPGSDVFMLAGTRVYGVNPADADQLTQAEIEGRRQVRAVMDLVRRYHPDVPLSLQGLPARIGLRESRHVHCQYRLTGDDVLWGRRFPDAVANGSYRVDIHHQDRPGITLRYLDGREEYAAPGRPKEVSRWRPATAENPTFYQIPLRAMLPRGPYGNVLIAGRMIDADEQAHAAIRVMVNMNQTGEAAGVACWLALQQDSDLAAVDPVRLRQVLAEGGSIML